MDAIKVYWWVFLVLLVGFSLEFNSIYSIRKMLRVSEVESLSHLPQRVQLDGIVLRPHFSGKALVFELEKGGRLTCYHRHPSRFIPIFSGDFYRVTARIEGTPSGKLCVVEEMIPIGFS